MNEWSLTPWNNRDDYVVMDDEGQIIAIVSGKQNAEKVVNLPRLLTAAWGVYTPLASVQVTAEQPEVVALGNALAGSDSPKPKKLAAYAEAFKTHKKKLSENLSKPAKAKTPSRAKANMASHTSFALALASDSTTGARTVTDSRGFTRHYYGSIWNREVDRATRSALYEVIGMNRYSTESGRSANWLRSKSIRYWRKRGMKRNDMFYVEPNIVVQRRQRTPRSKPVWTAFKIA